MCASVLHLGSIFFSNMLSLLFTLSDPLKEPSWVK